MLHSEDVYGINKAGDCYKYKNAPTGGIPCQYIILKKHLLNSVKFYRIV